MYGRYLGASCHSCNYGDLLFNCRCYQNDNRKYLPVICGTIGGILGTVAMYIMPDYPANDVLTAAAIGIASGFAATGVHQIFKQIKK